MSVSKEVQTLIEGLAEELGRSVAIGDPWIRPQYTSRHFGDQDPARVQAMLQHTATEEVRQFILGQGVTKWNGPHVIEGSETLQLKPRLCVPMRERGWLLGLIMVIDSDRSLTPGQIDRIVTVSQAVGAQMYADHVAGDPDQHEMRTALMSLLGTDAAARQPALAFLEQRRDWRSSSHAAVLVVRVDTRGDDNMQVDVALQMAMEAARGRSNHPCDFYIDGNEATLLYVTQQLLDGTDALARAERVASDLDRLLGGNAQLVMGVATASGGVSEAWRARHRASTATRAIERRKTSSERIALWDDLGVDAILLELPDSALTWDALPEPVQALAADDRDGKLVETLTVFLDEGGSISRTAERLHMHRTSLYYRLDKIRQITGLDLSDGEHRLLLHVGLHLRGLVAAKDE